MISISGVFAVTFSVVFAYVADVTTVEERSKAYGLVSATFAASLVSIMDYIDPIIKSSQYINELRLCDFAISNRYSKIGPI